MSHFIFKSRKQGGEIHKGEKDAKDRFEIYKMLKESGEEVISVQQKNKFSFGKDMEIPFLTSIRSQEKINFSRSLGSMIKAGLSMTQALSVMERQGSGSTVKKIISSLNEDVSKGKTLGDAMATYPKMFSPLFVAMVKSGEQSGTLSEALRIVTLQMDKNLALQRRVRGAMMYPSIIFTAMIIIAIILLTYVVPTLSKTFGELNVALPGSTRFILAISNILQHQGLLAFGVLCAFFGLIYIWSKKASGKSAMHKIVLHIPIIGKLVREVNVARTARTLSSLVQSNVDLLESLRITGEIIQNVHYRKIIIASATAVEKGDPLSKVFSQHIDTYPVFFSEMIAVGEETGKIGEMLLNVATYYEEDVDQKTKDMSTVIEPILMVIIGAAVGFFAVAMISPMYSLVNVI